VMNVRARDRVSAVASVIESETSFAAGVSENGGGPEATEATESPEASENGASSGE
jgi:hypothetical protein